MSKPPFDVYNTPFGLRVYFVTFESHIMGNRKITMTDPQGVQWFRYTKERWSYQVVPHIFTGKLLHTKHGDIGHEDEDDNIFVFQSEEDKSYLSFYGTDDGDWDEVFLSEEAAIDAGKAWVAKRNEEDVK